MKNTIINRWFEMNKKRGEIGKWITFPMSTNKAWEVVTKCIDFNNKKVLDVGCSSGEFFLYLHKKGFKFKGVGYDIDKSIKKVINFPIYDDIKKIRGKFDIVTIFEVIEHMSLEEFIKMIKKIKKIIRKGGLLIISTRNIASLREACEFWYDITHVRPYPYKDLIAILSLLNFTLIGLIRVECSLNPLVFLISLLLRKDWCNGYVCIFKKI